MSFDPEAIVDGLFQFLVEAVGSSYQTITSEDGKRLRVKYWSQVPEASQPALFVRNMGETDSYGDSDDLQITDLNIDIWIYCRTPMDEVPDTTLNALIMGIRAALDPGPFATRLTLGDPAIYRCRIEGKTQRDPGDLDQQAKAVIPVVIRLNPQ